MATNFEITGKLTNKIALTSQQKHLSTHRAGQPNTLGYLNMIAWGSTLVCIISKEPSPWWNDSCTSQLFCANPCAVRRNMKSLFKDLWIFSRGYFLWWYFLFNKFSQICLFDFLWKYDLTEWLCCTYLFFFL